MSRWMVTGWVFECSGSDSQERLLVSRNDDGSCSIEIDRVDGYSFANKGLAFRLAKNEVDALVSHIEPSFDEMKRTAKLLEIVSDDAGRKIMQLEKDLEESREKFAEMQKFLALTVAAPGTEPEAIPQEVWDSWNGSAKLGVLENGSRVVLECRLENRA